MLYLKLCTAAFVFLSGVKKAVNNPEKCNNNSTSVVGQFNKHIVWHQDLLYYTPLQMIHCAVESLPIAHGDIMVSVEFFYNLSCDDHHTIPLSGLNVWNCTTDQSHQSLLGDSSAHEKLNFLKTHGAYECVEKIYPETIYIKRSVYIHRKEDCVIRNLQDLQSILHEPKQYLIHEFIFTMHFMSEETKCFVAVNSSSDIFRDWITTLTFHLEHTTKYESIPDPVLQEANCHLELAINKITDEISKSGVIATYTLEAPDNMFHTGRCPHPGTSVEPIFQSGFRNEVPLCKKCQRGYFLDSEYGICSPCTGYHYSLKQGVLECSTCHNILPRILMNNGDSILDCYGRSPNKNMKPTLGRSSLFIAVFHLIYLIFMTWNFRKYVNYMLIRPGSIDQNEL